LRKKNHDAENRIGEEQAAYLLSDPTDNDLQDDHLTNDY
jgi:hypothetical protein